MTAKSLLMELEKRGAQLSLQNGEIVILANRGDIPPELLEVARQAKAEIKAILTAAERRGREFNPEEARQAIAETIDQLTTVYPEGALPWARRYRPDLIAEANAALKEVDTAFLAEDQDVLFLALSRYQAAIYSVFAVAYEKSRDIKNSL